MTTVISGTNDIDKIAAGAIEKSDLPAGTVLQVVQSNVSGSMGTPYFSTTANGLVDTGLSATITPTSSTSKILVLVNACIRVVGTSTDGGTGFGITRGSTTVWSGSSVQLLNSVGASTSIDSIQNINYLDSPATTSSTTYKFQVNRYTNNGGSTVYLNFNYSSGGAISADISTITLMEIGA